jgi:hypothetical protein
MQMASTPTQKQLLKRVRAYLIAGWASMSGTTIGWHDFEPNQESQT